jgi:hypothetical protein
MGVTMNMSSYEIEPDDTMKAEYDEEILCSGWNPAVALACQQHTFALTDSPMNMPSSLATVDADVFLLKMYACQG